MYLIYWSATLLGIDEVCDSHFLTYILVNLVDEQGKNDQYGYMV